MFDFLILQAAQRPASELAWPQRQWWSRTCEMQDLFNQRRLNSEMRMSITKERKKKKRLNRSKNKTPVRGPIPHWKMFRSCLITWRDCTETFPRADKENHTHPPVFGAVLSLCLSCIVKIVNHLLVLFLYVSWQSSKPVKYVPESLWRNVNFTHPFWFECNQTWIWLSLHNKGKIVIS